MPYEPIYQKPRKFYTIIAIFCPLFELIAILLARKFRNKYRITQGVSSKKIKELTNGLCEIEGKAVLVRQPIYSPLTQKECFYWELSVINRGRRGNSNGVTIFEERNHAPMGIDDGTGIAEVDIAAAEMKLKQNLQINSKDLNLVEEEERERLVQYGLSSNWFHGWSAYVKEKIHACWKKSLFFRERTDAGR